MKIFFRMAARFYAVRARRARAKAERLARLSEKFFARIKGVW